MVKKNLTFEVSMKKVLVISLLNVLFFGCEPEGDTQRAKGYEVHGIDLSHYQAKINWDTVAAQGINFAFVKATEGRQHLDKKYCENWQEMKRVGIKRGAYHFFRSSIDAEEQVNNFKNTVDMQYGDLAPVVDIETDENMDREAVILGLKKWLYLIELEYSIRPIIYTHYKFYNKFIAGEFDKYPIWIAKFGDNPPRLGSVRWSFWQYGNKGRLPGVEGFIDLNVFDGNLEDMEKLCLSGAMLSGGDFENRPPQYKVPNQY